MWDMETWKFINTFAPWLSAIGTLTAVCISVWLARRDKYIRLAVSANTQRLISLNEPNRPCVDIVFLAVTNIGHRSATIKKFYWSTGFFWKKKVEFVGINLPNAQVLESSPLPIKLTDGEEANYFFKINAITNYLNKFLFEITNTQFPSRRQLASLKIAVETSTGEIFEAPIGEDLKRWLRLPEDRK